MKLNIIYYVWMLTIFFIVGCSKDIGHYNYQPVNAITINGLLENSHPTGRIYELPFKDTIRLNPIINGSLSGTDTSTLTFEWKIDSVIVSKTKDLFYVANKRYGRIPAEFNVTDKSTTTVTSYHCFLNVVNPYKWGYYILTQNKAKEASLYCLSTIAKNRPWEKVLIPGVSDLGRNPLMISGVKQYGAAITDFFNVLTIGVQDAANPVMMVDSREFLPTLYYNSLSYVGGDPFTFRPSQIVSDPHFEVIYAVNNGKFHVLQQGTIALAAFGRDQLDYQVAPNGIARPYGAGRALMSIYDQKNRMPRVWDNGQTGRDYVYINDYKGINGQELMADKELLACSYLPNMATANQIYLFKKNNQLFSYRLDYDDNDKPVSFYLQGSGSKPSSEEISYVFLDAGTKRWYMAAGNTIYVASYLGVEFQKYVQLPADATGDIVKFKILDGKLMIATNDPAADKPGSIYIYNANTMVLEQAHKHVVDEIVDVHLGILVE
ncbi:MAG: hypothetical protein LBF27_23195 [Sphingobacterium sp.]|nr:hypothetical protein [Sphingobacterium sp.]